MEKTKDKIIEDIEKEKIIRLLLKNHVENWGVGKQLVIDLVKDAKSDARKEMVEDEIKWLELFYGDLCISFCDNDGFYENGLIENRLNKLKSQLTEGEKNGNS